MIETINQSQETEFMEAFREFVKGPYGHMPTIGKLSNFLADQTTLRKMVEFLSLNPQGKQAFLDRPSLEKVDLQQLHQLPKHTLGHVYADHMLRNKLTPLSAEDMKTSSFNSFDSAMFLSSHVIESHDIWHIVIGCDIDEPGEVQVEAFASAQLHHDRMYLAMLAKNLLRTAMYEIELHEQIMDALTKGWTMGKRAKLLFGVKWNSLWETSLEEVRASFNILV